MVNSWSTHQVLILVNTLFELFCCLSITNRDKYIAFRIFSSIANLEVSMLLFAAIIDKLGDKLNPEKEASLGDDEEKKWRQYVFFSSSCLLCACLQFTLQSYVSPNKN